MDQEQGQPRRTDSPDTPSFEPIPEPGMTPVDPVVTEPPARKQSGLGIASFIIGIVCMFALIASIAIATASVMDFVSPDGTFDESMMESQGMGALMTVAIVGMGSLALSFAGLILGIIGCVQKNRRKTLAIIGLILNGLLLVGFVGLMVIGFAMGTTAP
ncbi:hypothetical protein BG53_08740 [Paenibacillus darwinianus]|uniref:Uncharacterized protein n=1 Tax=Paenibacillus darwinianus TaxID=1380763 RepID=A0A9W5S382_9BACL|nr:hypothetical protein [Paenibacillus darwinianus]EXX91672.1 hypothetical protein CH50_13200 [Paenibacillus darwinianus]EXX91815.1 hypothetical protein BG53_08740 [Paenibacillus darwinianus]EXX92427.1 hypothetical protein BG52_12530 [Paenibacillus darwinianus]